MLWECWKPSKSLDKYNLDELWACYNEGENVFNSVGIQTGIKPPLRQVEQHFQSKWRKEGVVSHPTHNDMLSSSLIRNLGPKGMGTLP